MCPGYDASRYWQFAIAPIPRDDGRFYAQTWEQAIRAAPDGVLVNTWNEWGESTIVEPSREYGYRYLDMTRDFVSLLRR